MSETVYTKVYEGNFILVNRIKSELETKGIVPVIKDESESQRLAGYGSMSHGFQEVFVNNNELVESLKIVNRVKSEMDVPD